MPTGLIDAAWRAGEWERALCREIVYLRRKLARAQKAAGMLDEPDLSREPVLPGNLQSRKP